MGTELARRDIPAPTPQISRLISPQELEDHRREIAFEVKAVLSVYFQPHETEPIKAAQLAWWCDELQDWKREQVVWALRKWNRENPRCRPTPGDIVGIMKDARGRKIAAELPEAPKDQPREKVSPDAAAEIIRQAGIRLRGMGQ